MSLRSIPREHHVIVLPLFRFKTKLRISVERPRGGRQDGNCRALSPMSWACGGENENHSIYEFSMFSAG
jgi:hypothetical protein